MSGPISEFLAQDHARLDQLRRDAVARPLEIERRAYAQFREGLLRHIGMEEKILLPAVRRLRGGKPLAVAAQLRSDHSALAALLVPTPTHEIVAVISELLHRHNALEEGDGGAYDACERAAANELEDLLAKLRAAPPVPVAPHFDGPRVEEHIRRLLDAARGGRS